MTQTTTKDQTKSQEIPISESEFLPYSCACGEAFSKPEELAEHKAIYRWHSYIRVRKNDFVCRLCKKPFKTIREFVDHWNREKWHERQAFVMSYIRPRKTDALKVEMRPAERLLLRDRIRQDKTKYRLKIGKRGEKLLLREIAYSVKRFAMLTIVIVGIPDVGKSSVGLALAELIRYNMLKALNKLFKNPEKIPPKIRRVIEAQGDFEFYRPKVLFNFNVDHTTRQFAQSRLGYVIMQDEDPNLMGKHSGTIRSAIANLLNQMREAGVSLIFCDPEMVDYVRMPNLIIEVVGKDEDKRICKCIVYDRKKVARGWLNVRILDDDHPLQVKYRPLKTANVTKKKLTRGLDSVQIDWKEFKAHCRKAIDFVDHLEERGDIDPRTCPIRTLEIAILSAGIPSDSYIQGGVLETVKKYYRKHEATPDDDAGSIVVDNLKFDRLKRINEIGFLRKIADAWPYVLEKRKERKEKKPPKFVGTLHAEAWYLKYLNTMTAKDIGRELAKYHPKKKAVSHAMINNDYDNGGYPAIFTKEVEGECAEYAVWQDFFPDYEWVGGGNKPDLVRDDSWIEVKIRLEARKDLKQYITDWMVEHMKNGGSLTLVLVNYDFGKCIIDFYDVSLNDEENVKIENTD